MGERFEKQRRRPSVVEDDHGARGMRGLGDGRNVLHLEGLRARRFGEDDLRFLGDELLDARANERVVVDRLHFVADDLAMESLGISGREREVLELLAAGRSNKEIARELNVSPNTVKTHVSKLFEKLAVRRRTEAISRARELGILGWIGPDHPFIRWPKGYT